MFNKKSFWILFFILSLSCLIFITKFSKNIFPVLNLDISMTSKQAISEAEKFSQKFNLNLNKYHGTAIFNKNNSVTPYIELEGGGTNTLISLIRKGLYYPYTWETRLFAEGEAHEVSIFFTPNGKFYGFTETIPENMSGASLFPNEAQILAETIAIKEWSVDLSHYHIIENSNDLKPSGRRDYTFVYERTDEKIKDATYRLRLGLSGDKLTSVEYFIHVPQSFKMQYSEMRSLNNTIGSISYISAMFIFFVIGCIGGIFYLTKKGYVIYKIPLVVGSILALLKFLAELNSVPLMWVYYNTAESLKVFLIENILYMLASSALYGLIASLSIMAAESLTRKAFPNHIQLYKAWYKEPSSSTQVLGRIMGGYLFVPLNLIYVFAFYYLAIKYMGWWVPTEIEIDPNILATKFPWIEPFANSIFAGIWEECLFRAVPIAGLALIGEKYGKRNLFIFMAFILQIIIFSGGHATYPGLPGYSRLIELIFPSIIFGLFYLFFGIIPAIILHFAFDLSLMSMPLFVTPSSSLWFDRFLIILLGLCPILILALSRLRNGKWINLNFNYYNRAWESNTTPSVANEKHIDSTENILPKSINRKLAVCIIWAGLIGIVLSFNFFAPSDYVQKLTINREKAESIAIAELQKQGVKLPNTYKILSYVSSKTMLEDEYVWEKESPDIYRQLSGKFLFPPRWIVRFVDFQGNIVDRAQEYTVVVIGNGEVFRFIHTLPEHIEDKSLERDEARIISLSQIEKRYGLDASEIKEIEANLTKQPARNDWEFVYIVNNTLPISIEKRIYVKLAGDKVIDTVRYIYIPEEWSREYTKKESLSTLLNTAQYFFIGILILSLFASAIISSIRSNFDLKLFKKIFIAAFSLCLLSSINLWPVALSSFTTSSPFINQVLVKAVVKLALISVLSIASAFLGYYVLKNTHKTNLALNKKLLLISASIGFMFEGILSSLAYFLPKSKPLWENLSYKGAYSPYFQIILNNILSFSGICLLSLCIVVLINTITKKSNYPTLIELMFSSLIGIIGSFLLIKQNYVENLGLFFITTFVIASVSYFAYRVLFKEYLFLLPITILSATVINALRCAFWGVSEGGVFTTIVVISLLSYITNLIYKCIRNN